jgi:hypothetical protein
MGVSAAGPLSAKIKGKGTWGAMFCQKDGPEGRRVCCRRREWSGVRAGLVGRYIASLDAST